MSKKKYTLVAHEIRGNGRTLVIVPPEAMPNNTQRRLVEELVEHANEGVRRSLYGEGERD